MAERAYAFFEQVDPYSQACPDCSAKPGERCKVSPSFLPPSMVHIRRYYTPESAASIADYYGAKR